MKPYQQIPIAECGEALLPIPLNRFAVEQPHPYAKLGAPYGNRSPYFLRQTVLERLLEAQALLQQQCPGWRLQIFDAYRPIAVQQFMVDYTFRETVRAQGWSGALTAAQRQRVLEQVYQFWAVPSRDPKTPPPHSTGAAIDLTLADAAGAAVKMGSAIDELSPRSYPDHFAPATDPEGVKFHQHRQLLRQVMTACGFCQHPQEWWHFSLGDQMWAWQTHQQRGDTAAIARYGTV